MLEAAEVFKVFQKHRGDAIVIPTGTSGRQWADFTNNEKRDLTLGGAMGQTTAAALGVALSLPNEKVVLFDSEGALLMNLGVLATIAGMQPQNFYHFLLDNECYATTGGQPVPNAKQINYAGMAKEAGYAAAYRFDDLEEFERNVGKILNEKGPVFIAIKVIPAIENEPIGMRQRRPMRSRAQTIQDLQDELGISRA
ncbi:MAG: thiamine pyrophosphate-dependent enzyme [Candidatus Tectomicrobia bacterium]|jgi:sulfopyruvate decarboxylase subunit beta|nr:thiamine pyrophosphate-dependent enzyme [Candidatus Tectomicrobia bacterium]HEX2277271.1 thiamine pyrophosphate-dependent enzyme [Candidatus Tectomicrobia bacterium]